MESLALNKITAIETEIKSFAVANDGGLTMAGCDSLAVTGWAKVLIESLPRLSVTMLEKELKYRQEMDQGPMDSLTQDVLWIEIEAIQAEIYSRAEGPDPIQKWGRTWISLRRPTEIVAPLDSMLVPAIRALIEGYVPSVGEQEAILNALMKESRRIANNFKNAASEKARRRWAAKGDLLSHWHYMLSQ